MDRLQIFLVIFSFYNLFGKCLGLECYICKNVDGNNGPCLRNHMTCPQKDASCLSKVQWADHPYGGEEDSNDRILFVSKACMTIDSCNAMASQYAANCTRELYSDWTCIQCCNEDYCNYNVPTLSADGNDNGHATLIPNPILNEV